MNPHKKPYIVLSDWLKILQKASRQGGKVLSFESLRRISGLSTPALRRTLLRLKKKGIIAHVGPHLYISQLSPPTLEELAMVLGQPCYISFESALSRYGILSQAPQVLTCATTKKPKRMQTPVGEIVLRRMTKTLFRGYHNENGILWAEPEKALLDWLYWKSKVQRVTPDLDDLMMEDIDHRKLESWLEKYPLSLKRHFGKFHQRHNF